MAGKVGFPAVLLPRSLPQDAQATVSAITQRLQALEAAHTALQDTTQAAIFALKGSASSGSSSSSSTATQSYTAAVAIGGFQVLQEGANGTVSIADATISSAAVGVIGVATASVTAGAQCPVATYGSLLTVTGAAFAFPAPVYLGAAGALTQSPPAGLPLVQVGVAVSTTQMVVLPDQSAITWEFNGATIGAGRVVNFANGGGSPILACSFSGGILTVTIGLPGSLATLPEIVKLLARPQDDPSHYAPRFLPPLGFRLIPPLTPRRPFIISAQVDPSQGGAVFQQGGAH